MGLFGNLGESVSSLRYAFESLVTRPYREANPWTGFARGSALFVKHSIFAVTGSVSSVLDSFRKGIYFLVSSGGEN